MLIWRFQNANGENKKHKNIGEFADFSVRKNTYNLNTEWSV